MGEGSELGLYLMVVRQRLQLCHIKLHLCSESWLTEQFLQMGLRRGRGRIWGAGEIFAHMVEAQVAADVHRAQ
jgi:hypothetical protein